MTYHDPPPLPQHPHFQHRCILVPVNQTFATGVIRPTEGRNVEVMYYTCPGCGKRTADIPVDPDEHHIPTPYEIVVCPVAFLTIAHEILVCPCGRRFTWFDARPVTEER